MNTPSQRFNEARAYLLGKDVALGVIMAFARGSDVGDHTIIHDLWNSRIEPTAEHLPIIERIESIVTKLQTT